MPSTGIRDPGRASTPTGTHLFTTGEIAHGRDIVDGWEDACQEGIGRHNRTVECRGAEEGVVVVPLPVGGANHSILGTCMHSGGGCPHGQLRAMCHWFLPQGFMLGSRHAQLPRPASASGGASPSGPRPWLKQVRLVGQVVALR